MNYHDDTVVGTALTTRRRHLWIMLAIVILMLIVTWSVVAIIDGVTHDVPSVTVTPTVERTLTP